MYRKKHTEKTKRILLLILLAVAIIAGCGDDAMPMRPLITINDGKDIELDVANLDSLHFPVMVTSDDILYDVKASLTDKQNRIYDIGSTVIFDRPTTKFKKIYTIKDFTNSFLPPADSFHAFVIQATTFEDVVVSRHQNFTIKNGTTPLTAAQKLTWERIGTAPATGMDMFGLKWTKNVDGKAIIERGSASRFVTFSENQWLNIQTKEHLSSAIDGATAIDFYSELSVNSNYVYNVVLATRVGITCYLIHITNTMLIKSGDDIPVATIIGEYKR